jgi:hypothetical protein
MTGVGFYAKVALPPGTEPATGRPSFKLGDVDGTASNVKHGLGFLLYVTDGFLDMLEGYTYDEPWPPEIKGLTLVYSPGGERDMDATSRIAP